MQLREIGGKIQILRAEYVPAVRDEKGNLVKGTGRSKVKMLGSFDRWTSTLAGVDAELVAQLDEAERADLEKHFEAKQAEIKASSLAHAPRSIVLSLNDLTRAENILSAVSDDQVKQIRAALSGLLAARRAAKKKGG
ncbi:MAG: hypothetical protein ACYDAI_19240 [Trichloromonadaceae bacterium]